MSKKTLTFHIKSSDYFGTLATVISLVRQNLKNNNVNCTDNKINIKIFEKLEKDLMFLQKNYKIVKNK